MNRATITDSVGPDTVLRRLVSPAVEHVEVDGEAVVYDCTTNALHVLDQIGTLVWLLLDGTSSLRELSGHLADTFGRAPADTLEDVQVFARRLDALRLVERLR